MKKHHSKKVFITQSAHISKGSKLTKSPQRNVADSSFPKMAVTTRPSLTSTSYALIQG